MRGKTLKAALAVAVTAGAALAVWLALRGGDSYTSALPADTRALARVDLPRAMDAYGFKLADALRRVEGGDKTGLRLDRPVYAFASGSGYFGALASVDDEDDLASFAAAHDMEVRRQRGLRWARAGEALVCFDDDKILAMGPCPPGDDGPLRNEMAALMRQEAGPRPMLERLGKQGGCAALVVRADALPDSVTRGLMRFVPDGLEPADALLVAGLDAEKRALRLDIAVESDNPLVERSLSALDTIARPIEGDLLGVGPDDPFLWVCAGVRGDRLLQALRRVPKVRTALLALNLCVDADMMLRAVDGDVSLAVPECRLLRPSALLTAKLRDTRFLARAGGWGGFGAFRDGMRFGVVRGNDFYLEADGGRVFFGVRDDMLYATREAGLVDVSCRPSPHVAPPGVTGDDLRSCRLYATVDLRQAVRWATSWGLTLGADRSLRDALDALERLNVKVRDSRHCQIEVTTNRDIADVILSLRLWSVSSY